MTETWTNMSKAEAEALAADTAKSVIFATDMLHGFARPLRDGETEAQAVAEFEASGELCDYSRVFEPEDAE